jgi:outer membrane protein assembly factor BamB
MYFPRFLFATILGLLLIHATRAVAQTESELWNFTTAYLIDASPAIGTDGTIYVPSYENIYAMTPDGSNKWVFPLLSTTTTFPGIYGSPAIGPDGTIYFGGSADGVLYALDPVTGTNKWMYSISSGVFYSSPAIGSDGTIYIGSYPVQKNDTPYLYAFNTNGTLRWHYMPPNGIFSSPAISQDGATIYFGCDDGKMYALSTNGTTLRWAFNTGPKAITASPAIGPDGKIYIGVGSVLNPKFYCVNTNGTTNWVFNCTNRIQSSAAIGDDGTVYFGSDDMHLYALNTNGVLKWAAFTGATNGSSPAIAADGTIYIGSDNGNLYAFNGSGTNLGTFTTGATIFSSPAIGTNGTIYIGSEDDNIYALTGASGLARTPWPMYRHDLRHTAKYAAITNTPPVITAISNQTINQNTTLGPLAFTVSDAETPAGNLVVSGVSSNTTLVPNAALVFSGTSSNRFLTITPANNQSGTTLITLTVFDAAGATNSSSFLLTVNAPVNHAPQFVQTPNQTNYVMTVITITNVATDSDSPAQTLTFSLVSAPTNATINATNGVFTWTPTMAQGPSTNLISVSVTDNGVPPLSATNTFTIVVVPPPSIQSLAPITSGFIVTWSSIPQSSYRVQFKTNLTDNSWIDLSGNIPATAYISAWTNSPPFDSSRFYRVMVLP